MPIDAKALARRLAATSILAVDDEHYMRNVVRTMLMSLGVRNIYEAADGPAGLELIRSNAPDIVILDWQMPGLDGASFMRIVRSPDTSPIPTCRSSCSPAMANARAWSRRCRSASTSSFSSRCPRNRCRTA